MGAHSSLLAAALFCFFVWSQAADDSCPAGWTLSRIQNKMYCCPGSISASYNNGVIDGFCCIGSDASVSLCPGFPFCSGTQADMVSISDAGCVTKIPLTASDYSRLVSSAASSLSRSISTHLTGTAGGRTTDPTTSPPTASRTTAVPGVTSQGKSAPVMAGAGGIKGIIAQAGIAAAAAVMDF